MVQNLKKIKIKQKNILRTYLLIKVILNIIYIFVNLHLYAVRWLGPWYSRNNLAPWVDYICLIIYYNSFALISNY